MSKKILKNRVQFTSTLKIDLYAQLQKKSRESGVPISKMLDRAVEHMLANGTVME